jgi:hypothetical protein
VDFGAECKTIGASTDLYLLFVLSACFSLGLTVPQLLDVPAITFKPNLHLEAFPKFDI